jgi:regulator of replication initiation timing
MSQCNNVHDNKMKSLSRWVIRRLRQAAKLIGTRDEEIKRLRAELAQLAAAVSELKTESALALQAHEALKAENARLVAQLEALTTAAQADARYSLDTSTRHTEEAFEYGPNLLQFNKQQQLPHFAQRRTSGSPTISELVADIVDLPIPPQLG